MEKISIIEGNENERKAIAGKLYGLKVVPEEIREKIITAWATSIGHSSFPGIDSIPYSLLAPSYKLIEHVNEVTRIGLYMVEFYQENWNMEINFNEIVPILLLHDVDKPLLFRMSNGKLEASDLYDQVLHGVLGSYILNELGFPEKVVFSVSTHAVKSPIHGNSKEDAILHYADLFSADHAIMKDGGRAFYQKRILD